MMLQFSPLLPLPEKCADFICEHRVPPPPLPPPPPPSLPPPPPPPPPPLEKCHHSNHLEGTSKPTLSQIKVALKERERDRVRC